MLVLLVVGKTTTVTEAVYQLAHHRAKLNILLVAPSNDAADILVEKLSSYFPPSEMIRAMAYSRPLSMVPEVVRPYALQDGLERISEILSHRITVSTINLAARFAFGGVPPRTL